MKSCQKGPKHHEKEGKGMNFDQKSRNSCFFLIIRMPVKLSALPPIIVPSKVSELRPILQNFTKLREFILENYSLKAEKLAELMK